MWVYFNVPEAEYLDYKMHVKKDSMMKVHLIMANNMEFPEEGIVETIEADFNNETGNIAFRATFPNPDLLLRHGETGNIRVTSELKNALLIPQKATYEILDKKYVFVIDKDNVVHQRQIVIANELTHIYAVRSGLKEGDKILLEGLRSVKQNQKIRYKYVDPKSAISHLSLYAE
jgi:membrane fusion protein (multidrug efflux system)